MSFCISVLGPGVVVHYFFFSSASSAVAGLLVAEAVPSVSIGYRRSSPSIWMSPKGNGGRVLGCYSLSG